LEGPWCKPDSSADRELFLEAGGFGLFAETLVVYDPNQGKNVLQSIRSIAYALNIEHDYPCPMTLDGEDISGDYIMVEALNMSAFGPRLKFAPEADPSDGLLDVILIERDARESLLTYVSGLINGELENLPSVTHKRGKRLEIEWPGNFYFHVDAELIPSRRNESEESEQRIVPQERPGTVVIELLHKAVELWLPAPSEGVEPGEKPQQDPLTLPKQQIL
jgi:diacylglycerol kinase family enzyme